MQGYQAQEQVRYHNIMDDLIIQDDIEIKNGDLVVADSNAQNVEFIITAKPGQFYQFPTLGVGIVDELNGSISKQALRLKIKNNLEADNRRVNKIEVKGTIDQLLTSIDSISLE